MFLLVFQDFELASRLEVTSVPATWTVHVYDAHAGGLAVGDSLRLTLWPVLAELAVIVPAVFTVAMSWKSAASSHRGQTDLRPAKRAAGWVYLALAAAVAGALPLALVFRNAADGLGVFARDAVSKGKIPFHSEILTSAVFAIVAGAGASWLATIIQKRLWQKRSQLAMSAGLALSSVPGLVGSLVLSLAVLALIQLPVLSFFYRNSLPLQLERLVASVPLAVTLVVWLLPRALVMTLLLRAAFPPEPVHAAGLLVNAAGPSQRGAARMLLWQMKTGGIFWTTALLCYWAYWDLTAPSILMPVGMVAAPVRLYNFMHYSQTAMLSAMLCVTMAFPLVVLAVLALLYRPALRWLSR
jgi:ABC-type Fe3+ transport system permease subunit